MSRNNQNGMLWLKTILLLQNPHKMKMKIFKNLINIKICILNNPEEFLINKMRKKYKVNGILKKKKIIARKIKISNIKEVILQKAQVVHLPAVHVHRIQIVIIKIKNIKEIFLIIKKIILVNIIKEVVEINPIRVINFLRDINHTIKIIIDIVIQVVVAVVHLVVQNIQKKIHLFYKRKLKNSLIFNLLNNI
jgi:hypothetical protein